MKTDWKINQRNKSEHKNNKNTLNLEENEDILKWALENLNLKIMDIDLNIKNAIPGDKLGTNLGLEKAIKILPNKETEGFFIAKLRKI